MKYIEVGGVRIPSLGLGTWSMVGAACRKAVAQGLEAGYRHIDTAQIYGNEEQIGLAIRDFGEKRDRVFVTTKLWRDNLTYGRVSRATEASLRRLQRDYVDLLLIHWPNADVPLQETLGAMMRLKDAGKVRAIGVSNFPPSWMRRAKRYAPIVCNQVEYHPFLSQKDVLSLARRLGVLVMAYSPLAFGQVSGNLCLNQIGRKYCKSAVQTTLRWHVQQKTVVPLPKAASPDHCRSNLEVFDFELSDRDMQRIFGLAEGRRLLDPDFAPNWNE